jgi:hypothetical protein
MDELGRILEPWRVSTLSPLSGMPNSPYLLFVS